MEKLEKHIRLQAQNFIDTPNNILVEKHITDSFPLHWHNYFEIEIIIGGKGKQIINGCEYEISAGDAYILTTVDFHEIIAVEPIKLINISFTEEYMPQGVLSYLSNVKNAKVYHLTEKELNRITSACELLEDECKSDGPCIKQLCEYILNHILHSNGEKTPPINNTEDFTGIKKALLYIEIHFREKITLPQLAEIAGFNPTYFSELFRKVTGETYIEKLKSLRIGYAGTLLSNGCSVADACFTSGFGSLSNFLSAFKAKYGVTPSEYRKSHFNR